MNYAYISRPVNPNWHSDTIARFKTIPTESLEYIRSDARSAAIAGESINNPKSGQYWDEYHYATDELKRRGKL